PDAARRLDQCSAPSAQRKHRARIIVGADLQTIKIGCLRGKAGIAHDDVIIAVFRKGDLDPGIESEQRRVFTATDHPAPGIENLEQRIDSRSATPRLHLDYPFLDRKSTRLNSSHVEISYAVFCLKKKK